MIRIVLILMFGVMVSCHTPKKVVDEQVKTQQEDLPQTNEAAVESYYLGEVQVLDCGIVIQVSSGEVKNKYAPTNLDPKFQVDKLRLKLKFKVLDERATTCSEFRAIEITEVFAVR